MAKLLYMITTHSYDHKGSCLLFTIDDKFYETFVEKLGVLEFVTIQVFEMTGLDWQSRRVNSPCLLHTHEFRQCTKEEFDETLRLMNLAVFEELEGWS